MPEPEEMEGLEHEEPLGVDHPGSMAYKLAHADDAPQTEEEIEAARLAQEEADRVAAEEAAAAAAAENETPEERQAREAAEAEAKAALEPPKPKYASIEEAERAANEAARKMHEALGETAEARKAREAAEAELAEYREKEAAAREAEARAAVKPERKAAYADALKKIQAIPLTTDEEGNTVYPPDYDDQVAEAWASTSLDPHEVAKEAAKLAREELKREKVVEDTRTAAEREEADRMQVRTDAEKLAATMGLDMTPGSADYRLFYSHVDELATNPEHEYREKPFAEQVKWAATGVRQVLGKKIELTEAEKAAALKRQRQNAILERGITRQVAPEKPRQRSMQEILGQ